MASSVKSSRKPRARKKASRKPGRPRKPVPKRIADHICEQLKAGRSLRAICREDKGMPAQPTVMEWALKDAAFADQYARARELGLQAWEDEIVEIADNEAKGADTNRDRLRVDARKWIMSKRLPKKYGDRVALAGDPEAPLNAPITDQDAARQIALLMAQAATRKMRAKKK